MSVERIPLAVETLKGRMDGIVHRAFQAMHYQRPMDWCITSYWLEATRTREVHSVKFPAGAVVYCVPKAFWRRK